VLCVPLLVASWVLLLLWQPVACHWHSCAGGHVLGTAVGGGSRWYRPLAPDLIPITYHPSYFTVIFRLSTAVICHLSLVISHLSS
jgi:hypothetical protein